jgi:hypothetical protein
VTEISSWDHLDELVAATALPEEQAEREIGRIGTAKVAEILASEVQVRCPPAYGIDDAAIGLTMLSGDDAFRYLISFKNGEMLVSPGGDADQVLAEIRYTVTDLARLLYPPREGYESTSRDVRIITWPWERAAGGDGATQTSAPSELRKLGRLAVEELVRRGEQVTRALYRAVQCVITACSSNPTGLSELATIYGSDKWGALHWYTQHYERHLGELRYAPVRILEIGIGGYNFPNFGGHSLYMWQRFFPRGLIYGLDIHAKPGIAGPRIRTVQGDQNDVAFLRELAERHGPFDVVIDDGSHINEHVRTSFETLFPYVRPGGYYAIEDLYTSYWPALGGEPPPGSASTSLGMLKELVDTIHFREHAELSDDEAASAIHPSDLHLYHNLVILRRGINNEQGIPAWIRDRGNLQGA